MTKESNKFFTSPEVRVVEASAGSGKTYCLACRYVQLLLFASPGARQILMRNILAITFTNKAAYAMKGRILEFLKKIALEKMSADEVRGILNPLGLSLALAKPHAARIMQDLICRYNFFQVQTIDSFINALLSGCAFKIGLSAGFKIKRNYLEYLEHSFDRMIDRAFDDKSLREILSRFLHQYLFLENKTGWFPKKDMLDLLSALYIQSNTYGGDFVPMGLKSDGIYAQKKEILGLFRDLRTVLPQGAHKRFVESLDGFLGEYQDGFDFDRVSEYFGRQSVPVTKGVYVAPAVDELWQRIQRKLKALSETEAYGLFEPYVEVFNHISRDFYAQAAKDDVLFLPELNRRARALFDEGKVSVEELYYRLANRFEHYLLDEFQDTSRLQWQNLELMIEEALSTGGSLFYVGDKKQAIYGFRGGEVKLFDEIKDRFAAFNVQTDALTTNYRSFKAVVDFNNQVFLPENLKRFIGCLRQEENESAPLSPIDIEQVERIFHGALQNVSDGHQGGYVKVEYVAGADKAQIYAQTRTRLLKLIEDLKTRFSYSQIAILTRSNSQVEELTAWLMREGIFVESERTLNIKENSLIMEVVCLLRFLDSPVDNLSFAKFLGGEIFCKAAGLSSEQVHEFLFSHKDSPGQNRDFYLYRAFREIYPALWEKYFEDFFKNVGLFPLYELSSSVFYRFEVYANFVDEHGFFLRFLELVKEKEEEFSDLNTFLDRFESFENDEFFVNVVNSDAIKILTVHKAKGLEFPVVIIPFLEMKVHGASSAAMGQQSYIVDLNDENLKLLRIKKKYLNFSDRLAEIQRLKKVESFISELCNVYVALTRAGRELYAFIPDKTGSGVNMPKLLIPPDCLQIGSVENHERPQGQRHERPLGLPTVGDHDWIGFLKEEFVESANVVRRREILRGVVFHELFSKIGNLHNADPIGVVDLAVEETRARYSQIGDWEIYRENLIRVLGARELQEFFVVPDGDVFV